MQKIVLRAIGQKKGDTYTVICLDTDIMVQGTSAEEVERKVRDALLSYFKSFSKQEIERGAFIRKAPIRYFAKWYIVNALSFTRNILNLIAYNFNYDPSSRHINLAT